MNNRDENSWICFQIGAREHYSIPAMFAANDCLETLITDLWGYGRLTSCLPGAMLRNKFKSRYEATIHGQIQAANLRFMAVEAWSSLRKKDVWQRIMRYNQVYQRWASSVARHYAEGKALENTALFSYSYAAGEIFTALPGASAYVLGQIDPAEYEEKIVIQEHERYPEYRSDWKPAPQAYWENAQHEWELASTVVVNSEWSRKAMINQGVSDDKLRVIPLIAPEDMIRQSPIVTQHPRSKTSQQPLKVLFLGAAILRKGIARLLEAAFLVRDYPVEFTIVGYKSVQPPKHIARLSNITWIPPVSRLETASIYRCHDVFLFPTLSDGFGMTQLEALANGLPVLASDRCGEVVKHQVNGEILDDLSPEAIASTLIRLVEDPSRLNEYRENTQCTLNAYSRETIFRHYQSIP